MANPIEQLMYFSTLGIVGDPIFIGVLVLVWFGGFVLLQGVNNTPAKIVIIVPAFLLAAAFIPFLPLIIGLFVGFLLYLALMKLITK